MADSMDARMVVRVTQSSPCTGAYTLLVPEERGAMRGMNIRITGIGLERGTYRVRLERVGDS